MTMQTRGFGAARKPKDAAPIPPYTISPQLAAPVSDKRTLAAMKCEGSDDTSKRK